MMVEQLELDLWQQLADAEDAPEQSNVEQLCLGLDLLLAQVPPQQQLAAAGTAMLQIADIFSRRAELLLKEWKQVHSDEGPVLGGVELRGLVRQSMVFDLDDFMVEPEPITRRAVEKEEGDSVVAIVEKEVLLQELELLEPEAVLAAIEEEDLQGWVEAISRTLGEGTAIVSLRDLKHRLGLSLGRVWLALLLGGFELEGSGAFYMSAGADFAVRVESGGNRAVAGG